MGEVDDINKLLERVFCPECGGSCWTLETTYRKDCDTDDIW